MTMAMTRVESPLYARALPGVRFMGMRCTPPYVFLWRWASWACGLYIAPAVYAFMFLLLELFGLPHWLLMSTCLAVFWERAFFLTSADG